MIAEIIINITAKRLQQTFSYLIPTGMQVAIGTRVQVPFGHRIEEGIVVSVHTAEAADIPFTLKPITAILSVNYGFQEEMIQTAIWISNYYLCSLSDALRLFMIDKQGLVKKGFLSLTDPFYKGSREDAPIISLFNQCNRLERKVLLKKFPESHIQELINKNILREEVQLVNKIADKTEPWLVFVDEDQHNLLKHRTKQKELLQLLKDKQEGSYAFWHQTGFSPAIINGLVSTGLARQENRLRHTVDLTQTLPSDTPHSLTKDQQHAVSVIQHDQDGETYVLHGVTGSGKTEVYMKLTEEILSQGKQVIVLVPEIALTGQIVRRFIRRFGNDVVVQHSQLSKGERRNNWLRMINKESHICIGARSAVFTAVADLGLIIVDEAHDSSYKQDESPRYQAIDIARKRAAYYHCPVILGSATPSLNSYYKAKQGSYHLLELPDRVTGQNLPVVSVVDMREELARGNHQVISNKLAALLSDTLSHNRQAIILLNRRGFSTFVMCRKCGYVVKCHTCDVAMVYHKDRNILKCHYCDNEEEIPSICPSCGSKYIKFFGTGTQKVEEQLHDLFPMARIARLDQDSTTRKESGDHIIEAFRRQEYDILLGTQMVAKGHDFPNVSAVGILSADSLLNLPVYWAGERTFQLLTQAAGRAGRGNEPGQVVMQTYSPEHYVIECSKNQDYQDFYEKEIAYRQELLYPPFQSIIKITITYESEVTTWQVGHALADNLINWNENHGKTVEIIGPYVDTIKKIRNKYRIILLLKGIYLDDVKNHIKNEPDFYKTGIIIDVDPSY